VLDGVHTGATWRIRLNRPCAAAVRPKVKLLSPLVQTYDVSLRLMQLNACLLALVTKARSRQTAKIDSVTPVPGQLHSRPMLSDVRVLYIGLRLGLGLVLG